MMAHAQAHRFTPRKCANPYPAVAACRHDGRWHDPDVLALVECEAAGQLVLLEGE